MRNMKNYFSGMLLLFGCSSTHADDWTAGQAFTADGKRVGKGARSGLRFVRQADGKVRKYMLKENKGLNATR